MSVFGSIATAIVALVGVALGGVISTRNQERTWQREHERHWRDLRLHEYAEFKGAVRSMVAYIVDPSAKVLAKPHPRRSEEMVPIFDEIWKPFRERLEVAETRIRLVAVSQLTTECAQEVVIDTRVLAAARSTCAHDEIPDNLFVQLWASLEAFTNAARVEFGLDEINDWTVPESARREALRRRSRRLV